MNYRCNIHTAKECCNGHEFPVKFLDAGDFPDDGPVSGIVIPPHRAVIAAITITDGWSFTELNGDEKECIGNAMHKFGCDIGTWYWCELFTD